jgi:hypothetical protein
LIDSHESECCDCRESSNFTAKGKGMFECCLMAFCHGLQQHPSNEHENREGMAIEKEKL